MASGLPDYYRGVDIAYQALSEMIVRPKYGGAGVAAGQTVVTPNANTELLAVIGKGMIYGGVFWLDYTFTCANDAIIWSNDGQTIVNMSFLRLNDYGFTRPGSHVLTINRYDATNFIYSASLRYGLTFESSVKIYYSESYGRDPTVFYRLYYATV